MGAHSGSEALRLSLSLRSERRRGRRSHLMVTLVAADGKHLTIVRVRDSRHLL